MNSYLSGQFCLFPLLCITNFVYVCLNSFSLTSSILPTFYVDLLSMSWLSFILIIIILLHPLHQHFCELLITKRCLFCPEITIKMILILNWACWSTFIFQSSKKNNLFKLLVQPIVYQYVKVICQRKQWFWNIREVWTAS